MLDKFIIDNMMQEDFLKVNSTKCFYHYADYGIALNEILLNQSLKFSNPLEFNDPFDCNEQLLNIQISDELIDKTIPTLSKILSTEEVINLKKFFRTKMDYTTVMTREREKYKISCFSDKKDEVLMWSHYANKHQGICIGFNFPPVYKNKFVIYPVKYLNEIIPLDGTPTLISTIIYWLTTKSIRWEYEGEMRAIIKSQTTEKHEFINYESRLVKEIIFGCKVSGDDITRAIKILYSSNLGFENIVFKKMRIDKNTFLLKEEIID